MKWLMLVSSLDASDGGPPPAVLELARALVEQGQSVTVLTHQHAGQAPHPLAAEVQQTGVDIRWVARDRATRFQYSPPLLRAARELVKDADVVVAHGFYQWTCVVAHLVSRRAAIPMLLQPHGVFEPYQEQMSTATKRVFRAGIGRRVLRGTRAVVATSASEEEGIRATLGHRSPRIAVAGLGVSVAGVIERDFTARNVLFLSRIAPKKRLDKLIEAAAILETRGRPVVLTVCGDGDPGFVADLRASTGGGPDIRWPGHLTGEARVEVEASQSVFCLPSDNENFGQAVTEAMAVGLPVITTHATGSSVHVTRARCGWVLQDPTPTELADVIDDAFDEPRRLAQMSERGHEYAKSHLGWAAVAESWLALVPSRSGDR